MIPTQYAPNFIVAYCVGWIHKFFFVYGSILWLYNVSCNPGKCLCFLWEDSFEPRSEKTGLRGFRPGPTYMLLTRGFKNTYTYMRGLDSAVV